MREKRWAAGRAWPAVAVTFGFGFGAWLGLGPGPLGVGLVAAVALGLALRWAGSAETSRLAGPGAGRGSLLGALWRSLGWTLAGGAGALLLAALWAAMGAGPAPVAPARADAIYELDARVASRPLPDCRPRALSSRVLLDRGAHPRLPPEGAPLWFDAQAPDGRRQVHRLDRATGTVVCWTCDEAGNNERPFPGAGRYAIVFETDRYASWREPRNREIQMKSASGEAPSKPSIRLTIDPAADRWPVLGPGGQLLLWSRDADGRSEVAGAVIRRGHGGILLGTPSLVARGGLAAALPLAWSEDARTIVIARGNPLGTLEAVRLDPATGEETTLGGDAVAAPAGTSADGGWLALPTSEPVGVLAHLPSWLGFLTAAGSTVLGPAAPSLAGTGVRSGEPTAPGTPLDLGEVRGWGAPTGVALDPDGRSLVLGQRRSGPDGVEERLVEITLDCAGKERS